MPNEKKVSWKKLIKGGLFMNTFKKVVRIMTNSTKVALGFLFLLGGTVYAANDPEVVTKTIQLINDATTWVLGIVAAAGVTMGTIFAAKAGLSEEPSEKAANQKKVKQVIIWSVGAFAFGVFFKFILSYYGYNVN